MKKLWGMYQRVETPLGIQVDRGMNEVPKGTFTAMSIGPLEGELREGLEELTKDLKLYR